MGNESSAQSPEEATLEEFRPDQAARGSPGSRKSGSKQQEAYFCESGTSAPAPSSAQTRRSSNLEATPKSRVGKQEAAEANARGVDLLRQQDYEEAIKHFKEALSFEPGSVQILNNIGLAFARAQDHNSAYEWYEKAYNQDKGDVETLFSLAWVERKRHKFDHARQLFQKVLEIQPEHMKALYLLGDIMKTNQEFEGAARHFERLVRNDPNSIDGHISLGQCYEHMKLYPKAAQIYEKSLQLDPCRMDVIYFFGRVQFLMKQYKQCIVLLDRVPDTDARALEARSNSAKACRELEDHARSISYAERAAKLRPLPEVMHFLGEAHLLQGDTQKAAHYFSKALELDPNRVPSLLELGQLMYKQSRFQEAETHFGRACDVDQGNLIALKNMALATYKLKKYGLCRQCCERTVQLEPLNADALWLLAELNKSDERWYLNLRYPPEVAVSDVCNVVAKAYIARGQVVESADWLRKVQTYLPLDLRVQEALKMLSKQGGTFNPQDVLHMLEQTTWAPSSASYSTRDRTSTGSTVPATNAGVSMSVKGDSAEDLERLLRRAERASAAWPGGASDQWTEVLTCAKSFLRRHPNDQTALKIAARALVITGGDASAIKEYVRRATENNGEASSGNLGFELHVYLAGMHERDFDFQTAEKHYTAALNSNPGDEAAQLGLARLLLQRGELTKAKRLYEQVSATHPNCAESHARLGDISYQAGDYTEAHRLASKATIIEPKNAAALLCQGKACAKLSRNNEALQALEQGLALTPTDVPGIKALADLHKRAGRDQEALTWFKRLLDLRPGDYECSLELGDLHAAKGAAGASQALHYFRSALQCRPSSRDKYMIYIKMSTVQCGIKAWKDAQQLLETASREFPEEAEVWSKLLLVYTQQQDKQGQQLCHQSLAQLNNMSVSQRVVYGEALENQGQMREAREQYEQAVKADPKNTAALMKLGNSWRQDSSQEKNLEEAKKLYDKVLQASPNHAEALEQAAYCNRKLNNLDLAVTLYQSCLKVSPMAEGPLYYLGDILYKQHRHAECQHYLTRLVDPSMQSAVLKSYTTSSNSSDYKTGALYILAKSHVALDEYSEAEQHARRGLKLKPNHPHFLFILALVKNRVAEYDESISTLQQALQHCDSTEDARSSGDNQQLRVEIHDWLAQAYERKREYGAATAQLQLALQQDPSHVSSLLTKGLVHTQLKQYEQAETSFRRALAVEKNHALALVRLGYCRLLNNDHQEATQLFQRALGQRCGTVALPKSVKGSARVYMALALMGQLDVSGALFQLSEARKNHKNLNEVCNTAKDSIVKGECEQLVNRLKAICDLDVNTAQAWQLVHLMAKELELDLKEPAANVSATASASAVPDSKGLLAAAAPSSIGSAQKAGYPLPYQPKSAGRGTSADPAALGPRVTPPGSTPGYSPLSLLGNGASGPAAGPGPLGRGRPPNGRDLAGGPGLGSAPPSLPSTSGTAPSAFSAKAADGQENPQARRWNNPSQPAEQEGARRWTNPPQPPEQERRQWNTPAEPQQPAAVPASSSTLKLELHEQIDVKDVQQEECLGTGGFGAVYRGFFRGQEIALKKILVEDGGNISPLQLAELEGEVAALKKLSSPRLVAFIGACLVPPNLCIVTEYMPGGSLHTLLHKVKKVLLQSQQAKMALQVTEGVSFLHSQAPPVVHRDLKSLNIVLDLKYNAKICDFGLTTSMEKTHISLKEGGNGGSPRYMAPECWDNKSKITAKVDVWAEGCLLVEMFGGPLPYDDCQNIPQIMSKILIDKQVPYIPHHLPHGVRAVVEDCFIYDISLRITSQDVYSRLGQLGLRVAREDE